jgi:hypothetical protein
MTETHAEGAAGEAEVIDEILDDHARIDGDVVEIDSHTWAIYGFIAGDGEVLLAEFDRRDSAVIALQDLAEQR